MGEPIRVLLADDHPLVRAGIRATLATEQDLTLVGEAVDGYEVQRLSEQLRPDVLLLDLSMPGPPPVELVRALLADHPALRIIILSAYDDDAYVRNLVAARVAGYVLKDEATEAVVDAIRTVVQGAAWFSRPIVEKLVQWRPGEVEERMDPGLTGREQEILSCIARGWDNSRIALELNLAEQTVRNYASRIYAKLEVNSRAEAIIWAREKGFNG